jgi:hypothetical protein
MRDILWFFQIPVENYKSLDAMKYNEAQELETIARFNCCHVRETETNDNIKRFEENWYN